jgi:hypothetical protein
MTVVPARSVVTVETDMPAGSSRCAISNSADRRSPAVQLLSVRGNFYASAFDCLRNRGDDSITSHSPIPRGAAALSIGDQTGRLPSLPQKWLRLPGTSTHLHDLRAHLLHTGAGTHGGPLLSQALFARTAAPRPPFARLLAPLQPGLQVDQLQLNVQQLHRKLCDETSLRFVLHQEPGSLLCVLQTKVQLRLWR